MSYEFDADVRVILSSLLSAYPAGARHVQATIDANVQTAVNYAMSIQRVREQRQLLNSDDDTEFDRKRHFIDDTYGALSDIVKVIDAVGIDSIADSTGLITTGWYRRAKSSLEKARWLTHPPTSQPSQNEQSQNGNGPVPPIEIDSFDFGEDLDTKEVFRNGGSK